MASSDIKIEFSDAAIDAMDRFRMDVENARANAGLLTHDEQLRLAAVGEAVKLRDTSLPTQIPSAAGAIESYLRYGRSKNAEGFTNLGPECFIGNEGNTISFQGANFYRACDRFVSRIPGGGGSHCVKRVGHPSDICEDYDGNTRNPEES